MIAVIGAGAIGSVVAAELTDAGHEVVLCTRRASPHQTTRVDRGNVTSIRQVRTIANPAEAVGPADWILLATKAYDTADAASWFGRLFGPGTRVVVLQNGIDQVERIAPLLPPGTPVLPALIHVAAEMVEPGHAKWTYGENITVPAGPVADQFADLFTGALLRIVKRSDFAAAAWQKVLVNVVSNPITTLTGRRMEVFGDSDIELLGHTLVDEAVTTARAANVDLTDDDIREARDVIDSISPETGTSMLYDRLAGRPTEHEQILGPVVRTADALGVPVPSIKALLALLRALPETRQQARRRALPRPARSDAGRRRPRRLAVVRP